MAYQGDGGNDSYEQRDGGLEGQDLATIKAASSHLGLSTTDYATLSSQMRKLSFIAKGSKIIAKGNKIIAKGNKIIAKGSKIIAKGSKIIAKGSTRWSRR